jgi:hypothetical protein
MRLLFSKRKRALFYSYWQSTEIITSFPLQMWLDATISFLDFIKENKTGFFYIGGFTSKKVWIRQKRETVES